MKEFILDAKNRSLGRVASEAALILQGKQSASYEPRKVGDSKVVIKNVKQLKFTGKKLDGKIYYRHTGYIGHLKSKTLKEAFAKSPEWVLKHAVKGMLPKNLLLPKRLKLLTIEE